MSSLAMRLAGWAHGLRPGRGDLELAGRSLLDIVAVALAARDHPVTRLAAELGEEAQWAVAGHALDFDDLHMESTTHISAVCVPTALATGGGARAYLAAAGVMARLGTALGWRHYSAGWHATCTAGAPASAAGAAVALGLVPDQIATAIALAIPAAGGVQRAFGTDAKSLQVGFTVAAGIRAARLAAAGARANPSALDAWLPLVGAGPAAADPAAAHPAAAHPAAAHPAAAHPAAAHPAAADPAAADPAAADSAVPGGLAVKVYPCCYALQRPISALAGLAGGSLRPAEVSRVVLRTPEACVTPLIHHRPVTGLEGKFSLEYGAAAALLDGYPGFASFTDEAVRRPAARRLTELVEVKLDPGGSGLLDGELEAAVYTTGGDVRRTSLRYPPGSPANPPDLASLRAKLADCVAGTGTDPMSWTWDNAADVLREGLAS